MRLSCLPVSFFPDILSGRMSVRDWAQLGAEVGLDGIDLSILFVKNRDGESVDRMRQEIDEAGTRVAMVTTYPDFTHPDAAKRARELEIECENVRIAERLGAELVRVTAGQAHPDTSRQAGIRWSVDAMARLVDTTSDLEVTLAYENHGKPGAWRYTDFSQPPDIFLEIAEATASIGMKINFDTANATAFADDPLALLDRVVERVVSVHAADTAMRGQLRNVALGSGLVPFDKLFARLKKARFDGWICIEEASFLGREGVEQAAAFVHRAWSEA
jgi:sugar phosphate isomerase/epimerase